MSFGGKCVWILGGIEPQTFGFGGGHFIHCAVRRLVQVVGSYLIPFSGRIHGLPFLLQRFSYVFLCCASLLYWILFSTLCDHRLSFNIEQNLLTNSFVSKITRNSCSAHYMKTVILLISVKFQENACNFTAFGNFTILFPVKWQNFCNFTVTCKFTTDYL